MAAKKPKPQHIGFEKLEKKIAAKGDVSDPGAVAAAIGRQKYGAKAMARKAAAGRRKAAK
jgi:hypothetical protein